MAPRLVIISGLSGSGKSTALHAFEDLGYYAVDNLPIKLLDPFAQLLLSSSEFPKVALVMDLRDSQFIKDYPVVFRQILPLFKGAEIIFLESSDDVLIRRFSETRRKHPLADQNVPKGISEERKLLSDLKGMATTIIDTSAMDGHSLKRRINDQFDTSGSHQMQIRLISFGFKYGIPKNCDLLFDVRFLSNPHFVAELRDRSGLDEEVADYVSKDSRSTMFLEKTVDYLKFLIPHYAHESKSYLTIGIGCTGGKHRSVFIANQLAERLRSEPEISYPLNVEHQDLRLSI